MNFEFFTLITYSVKGNKNLIGEVIRIPVGKRRIPIEKVDDFAQLMNVYCNFFAELCV